MIKKLRLRFVLINMGIIVCMLGVIFGLVFHFTKVNVNAGADRALDMLVSGNTYTDKEINYPYILLTIAPTGSVNYSGNANYDLSESFIRELIGYVYNANQFEGTVEKYDLRYKVQNFRTGQYIAFVDTSLQNSSVGSAVKAMLIIGGASLVVFLGISILLARWTVKPVEEAWAKQKRFVSDASHELKTPLTVIMSNAELLTDEMSEPEKSDQYANNILTMSKQMRVLVESLLELSRADNGQIQRCFDTFDFSELVTDASLPFEPVLFEKNMTLECNIEPGITMVCNSVYLRQVVDVLLDNAGKYGAPGTVCLDLKRQGRGHCLLTVSNPGTPIATEDSKKIFDRFYRADEARSSAGSFGLGLAIAKSVAEEHHGKIWVDSNSSGNCFCLLLPCNN